MARVGIFLIVAALVVGTAGCGGGTPIPPSQDLEIYDWYDLDAVRDNLAGNHILMNDLDSTTPGYTELASPTANDGKGWQPIGYWDGGTRDPVFRGVFDGNGREIRDLSINRPDEGNVGLFGVNGGGVIERIGVSNATVIGGAYVGGLVGWNVVLIGWNDGIVSSSHFIGNITAEGPYGPYVGGLVGWNDGTLTDSFFSGGITAGGLCAGGLVGSNSGAVNNSHSTGNITGNNYVGGVLGSNEGSVSNSHFTGNIVAGGCYVAGLVGVVHKGNTVRNSHYNYDEVLINGEHIITIGAMFNNDFEQWLTSGGFLDVSERLAQEDGYYVVNNVSDFKQLLAFGQNSSLRFRLASDLSLADEPDFYIPYLAGEFDGNGRKISNFGFHFGFVSDIGLFGYVAATGKVAGVAVEEIDIGGYQHVGGLAGENYGTVVSCYSTGNASGNGGYVGGLVGSNHGTLSDSRFVGSVAGDIWRIGGLVGQNDGTIGTSYSSGVVTVTGYAGYIGGLIGDNEGGTVTASYSTATVSGDSHVGGLVGLNWGSISNCYSSGNVTGDFAIGGLVGHHSSGSVSNSYSIGHVTGNSRIGGLVGESYAAVSHCFWDTQTSGQSTSAGGTGKTTTQMKNIATFSGASWNTTTVANTSSRNLAYIWNIVSTVTYPFLSWQPVS